VSDSHADIYSHGYCNSDTDSYGDCNRNGYADANEYAETYTYSTSASYAATASDPAPLVEVTSSPAAAITEAGE
jgi:hypothetical protein